LPALNLGYILAPIQIAGRRCGPVAGERLGLMDISNLPKCQKCKQGDLVPLSDFGSQGAAIHYKAWACTNPDCGFNIKIRNGDLYIDEPIASGALHSPRML
jgi:hypothetical protein